MTTLDQYWLELVGTALLGTDRRDPPSPPTGALAEFALEHQRPTGSQRLLQQVAACVAVRRAGVVPAAPVPAMAPPQPDPRPITAPGASHTWRTIASEWPLLEDEWVLAVIEGGYRLAPDLVPLLLARHRGDAVRHGRVVVAAGPLATWLIEWVPALACTRGSARPAVEALISALPELPITPEFSVLLQQPDAIAERVAQGLSTARLGAAHRAVLQHLVARMPATHLAPLVAALDRVNPASTSIGLAFALADLARLRHRMLTELEPA
jgi:hypothetical protein